MGYVRQQTNRTSIFRKLLNIIVSEMTPVISKGLLTVGEATALGIVFGVPNPKLIGLSFEWRT